MQRRGEYVLHPLIVPFEESDGDHGIRNNGVFPMPPGQKQTESKPNDKTYRKAAARRYCRHANPLL